MRPVSGISLEEAGGHREAAGLGGDQAVCPDPGDAGVREGVPGAPPPLRHACLHRGRGQSCQSGWSLDVLYFPRTPQVWLVLKLQSET